MAHPNKHRGEVGIELGGETYVLRPSMSALERIESESGEYLTVFFQRFSTMQIKIPELRLMLEVFSEAGGRQVDPEQLERWDLPEGWLSLWRPLFEVFEGAMSGGKEADPDDELGESTAAGRKKKKPSQAIRSAA